jgi:hypothetical protein
MRVRSCSACGFTGKTFERWDRVYRQAPGKLPASTGQAPGKQVLTLISSESDPISLSDSASVSKPPERARARGKAVEYSQHFETAWKLYGRKEEKAQAFAAWKIEGARLGGEEALLPLILRALAWQAPIWAADGWRFAKYFERYLKRRKWEDEPSDAARGQRQLTAAESGYRKLP